MIRKAEPLHVEHVQPMRSGQTWCGLPSVQGPRIIGVENLMYYAIDGAPGPVCAACVLAVVNGIRALDLRGGIPR